MSGEVELVTDLDCNNFKITNLNGFDAIPPTIVGNDDPRLSDKRNVPNGSITDASVSATAAIDQSKLNLAGGTIPNQWIGTHSYQAAKGSLVERVANKNVANGYARLDSNGLLDLSVLPFTGPQTGTVTIINLDFPDEFFFVPFIHTAFWDNIPNNTWFGVNGPSGFGTTGRPGFVSKQIPIDLIPSLDASIFITGIFDLARLPVMQGLGVGHAKGIVPDPGDGKSTPSDGTDYLARDATYKPVTVGNPIQPFVPKVHITFLSFYRDQTYIEVRSHLRKSNLFYRITAEVYQQADTDRITLLLDPGTIVNAYAAKAGYNNSPIAQFVVPANPNP